MTRELLSLDDLPPSLLSAARTLVAVPSPDGVPLKYKAALTLGSSLGGTGQGFTVRGAWTPATAYAANDVLTYDSRCGRPRVTPAPPVPRVRPGRSVPSVPPVRASSTAAPGRRRRPMPPTTC